MRKMITLIMSLLFVMICSGSIAIADTDSVSSECDHDFYEYQVEILTCEQDGITERYCWDCGYSDTIITPATGHDFGEWKKESPATCEEDGQLVQSCQNLDCDEENYDTIPATGHNYGKWYYETEWDRPDCESTGIKVQDCQNKGCYEQKTKSVPAIGHSFGKWHYEDEWDRPDCTYSGTMVQDCKRDGCYEQKYKNVAALGHKYKNKSQKAKPKKNGYTRKVCTRCGSYKQNTSIYAPKRIKLSKTTYTYNGKAKKPTVKVYNNQGNLIKAKHYTVSYQKGRKNVGTYKVTVTFKKSSPKYTGKLTTNFKINPKPTSIYTLTKGKESFKVKWKKVNKQVTGYQIRYSEYSDMDWAEYKTIKSSKTVSKKISNLYEDEKYYVQIRTYKVVNGKKYYSSWSKKKTVRTKKSVTYSYADDDDDEDDYYGTIYVTRTGSCYHTHKCGNGTYYPSTLSEALDMGLRPCQKCF